MSLTVQIYLTVMEVKKQKLRQLQKVKKAPPRDLAKKIVKEIGKNFVDIIKTPLYAVAMTVVVLSTLILTAFKQEYLYEGGPRMET